MPAFWLTRYSWLLCAATMFTYMAGFVLSSACASAMAADSGKLTISHNPGGTFTVQKEPPNRNSKDAKAKEGLVIPPQVVTPIFSTSEKK